MQLTFLVAWAVLMLPLTFGIEAILNYLSPSNKVNPHFATAIVISFFYETANYFGVSVWIADYFS